VSNFAVVSNLLLSRAGIYLAPDRDDHLDYCLQAACQEADYADLDSYLAALIQNDLTHYSWQYLLHYLAIGETYFFRDSDLLFREILPKLIARRRVEGSYALRIWSAGCATGEEPYSVAMLLRYLLPDLERWKITILGTDINEQALIQARRGRYSTWSIRGAIPPCGSAYLMRRDDSWQLSNVILQMVDFRYGNLIDPQLSIANADIILCRNVLLYMAHDHRRAIMARLKRALTEGGELLVGNHDPVVNPVYQPARVERVAGKTILPLPLANSTERFLEQARKAADNEQWDEAHGWLDKVLIENRLDLSAYYLRALIFEGQGLADEAVAALRRCLYLDHNFALGYFTLGNLYARRGDRGQANSLWANAAALLKENPSDEALPLADGLTAADILALIDNQLAELSA
jgi:chemotaxis protein methyltransferase CheR